MSSVVSEVLAQVKSAGGTRTSDIKCAVKHCGAGESKARVACHATYETAGSTSSSLASASSACVTADALKPLQRSVEFRMDCRGERIDIWKPRLTRLHSCSGAKLRFD